MSAEYVIKDDETGRVIPSGVPYFSVAVRSHTNPAYFRKDKHFMDWGGVVHYLKRVNGDVTEVTIRRGQQF